MTEQTQSQQNQNQNPEQLRDRATQDQQQLLEQYADLIAQNTEQATIQAVNDSLERYELLGIQKGYQSAKKQVTGMMQERLEQLNQQNSKKIVEMRAGLPEVGSFDNGLSLQAPSLEEGISQAHNNYGVLTSKEDQAELPSDLQESLEA